MTDYNQEHETTVKQVLSLETGVNQHILSDCSEICSDAPVPAKVNGYRDGKGYRGGGKKGRTWKWGRNLSYFQYHLRVRQQRGQPQHCEYCETTDPLKRYEWANVTGAYEDPLDYIRLCKSCHISRDKREKKEQWLRDLYRQASEKRFGVPA